MPRPGDERMQEVREVIARNLKLARQYRGLKQRQLSDETGVVLDTLRTWEQGKHAPDAAALGVLADVLQVNPGDFYLDPPPRAWIPETPSTEKSDEEEKGIPSEH